MSITSAYESSAGGDGSFPFNSKVEGYDYEFVPAPDTRYECAICMLVLREPRQTPCGHRFCKDCILKWLRWVGVGVGVHDCVWLACSICVCVCVFV